MKHGGHGGSTEDTERVGEDGRWVLVIGPAALGQVYLGVAMGLWLG